jgi:RimJ/RimL family protein N-acetyltransferase
MPALEPPEPPLTDGVVALRGVREADADQVVAALRDPDIVRWTRVPAGYTHEDFAAYLHASHAAMRAGTTLSLLVVDADDHDRVLGSCGLHELDSERADIGYWVARGARGRGVAPRATALMRDHATGTLGLPRVEVLVHPDNVPSQRVAEKAGFARTGELRPSPRRDDHEPRPELVVFAYLPPAR